MRNWTPVGLGLLLLSVGSVAAAAAKHDKPAGPPPAMRILSEPLGYHASNSFYAIDRLSSSSLDFIDDDHLLFTFRVPGLLKRLDDCQPDDEDQVIHAVVLHLPEGKVVRTAEWRMHDRGRYLWPLPGGRFLIRQRDALLTTDSTLQLEPYLQVPGPLKMVKLSPDAHLLLVETDLEKHTPAEHQRLVDEARAGGMSAPREDVLLSILRTEDHTILAKGRSLNANDLPLLAEGYLENLAAKGDHWMIRYVPFRGEPQVLAEVASSCRPNENALNLTTAFVSLCAEKGGDHEIDAITLEGKRLWSYRWDDHFIWPTTAYAQDGRRVAFSTLRINRPVSAIDPVDESDLQAQRIEVFDVTSGKLALTQYASPIVSAGQNYSLSPDSSRFAVQRDGAIEVYELPSVSIAP